MKKILLLLILIIAALSICACGKNKASYDVQKDNVKSTGTVNESNTAKYELTDILNNKIPFTDKSGKSVYLKNYRSEKYPDLQIKPDKYTIIDLDNDGANELVLYLSPDLRLLKILCKPPRWYKIEISNWRLYYAKVQRQPGGTGGKTGTERETA